jgi:hypothetical protein
MRPKKNTNLTITLLSCAALAVLSATASAAVMTYTETGFLSGSLGGTSFTNAAVTLRVTADTANVQEGQYLGFIPMWTIAGVTTIDIVGFETATFNGSDSFGAFNLNLSGFLPGTAAVGVGELTTWSSVLGNSQTAELNYALATEKTFTGAASNTNETYSTTLGNLITTDATGNATFTATEVSAVPEVSSSLALLALGAGGLLTRRRMQRAVLAENSRDGDLAVAASASLPQHSRDSQLATPDRPAAPPSLPCRNPPAIWRCSRSVRLDCSPAAGSSAPHNEPPGGEVGHRTSNIEHRSGENENAVTAPSFEVPCWMFDVRCSTGFFEQLADRE